MIKRKLSMDELGRKTVDEFKNAAKLPIIVILDNVRSLHNIGSIFRTSDAFLVESIYICGISTPPPHPEIHKSALGAENSVHWQYFNETKSALSLVKEKGYVAVSAEQTDQSIKLHEFDINANGKYALIFGNEVRGVDQEIINECDFSVEIPQFGTKHSFNVSVSAGVILWEWYKNLQKKR